MVYHGFESVTAAIALATVSIDELGSTLSTVPSMEAIASVPGSFIESVETVSTVGKVSIAG